ncbi:Uncharacterised protein [uncultured archaeon]|nr:Uncharacterised protein [uncultured archaeon]
MIEMNDHELSNYLKNQGVTFEERVEVFERLFPFDEVKIRKSIRESEEQYEKDPAIEKRFREDYTPSDFIPGIGMYLHNKRNDKKDFENYIFFKKANEGAVSRLKRAGFSTYQYLSTATPIMFVLNELIK